MRNGALVASDAAAEAVTKTVFNVVAVVTITGNEEPVRLVAFHWTRTPSVT